MKTMIQYQNAMRGGAVLDGVAAWQGGPRQGSHDRAIKETRRPVQAAEAALTTMEAKGGLLLESTVE
jgi:hypothetical protein